MRLLKKAKRRGGMKPFLATDPQARPLKNFPARFLAPKRKFVLNHKTLSCNNLAVHR
jgi:hypothetical protein